MSKTKDTRPAGGFRVNHQRIFRHFAPLFYIAAAALVVVFVVGISTTMLTQNVETRALAELQSTAGMQASAVKDNMDEQFQPLNLIEDMFENGNYFTSDEIQPTLNSIVNTFQLCALCMADMDGNTIDYQGNSIGSCADREYFQEIANGSRTRICEYLPTTKDMNEPRVILSVPAYDANGKMIGVLFCSKEISILEKSLFAYNDLFDSTTATFICDESGQVIVANESGYDYFSKHDIDENDGLNINNLGTALQQLSKDGMAQHIDINGSHCFAGHIALDECGWSLYCLVDESDASETYRENLKRTEEIIASISLVFLACIICILILGSIYRHRVNRESSIIQHYNDNYRNLLNEMHCAVVEYDAKTGAVATVQENFGDLELASLNGNLDNYECYKQAHPEFDFEELESEIRMARVSEKSCSFETILAPGFDKSDSFYWLKVKVIPIANENGEMIKIYCALLDVSDLHRSHEMEMDTYAQVPGAVHRHVLDEPIHLNYYSNGLCKMLGYSRAEINELIGSECHYSRLVCEDDRPAYCAFCKELAEKGGTQSCEYRMNCKDGTLLEVSDTTDAKRSSSGVMYGYSVVTDLSKYRKEQQRLERELKETRNQLTQSRIKNANSQMQPHFLYNALSSIREIVLEDPEYASDLIYDFTVHLRACIRSMMGDTLVPFTQELENIKAYANIEKMRFGDRLSVKFNCQETDFNVIPLSVQPIVENAIRHGIFNRGASGGTVSITTTRDKDCILICVEDNGVGFDYAKTMQEVEDGARDSSGLSNLIFRFDSLMEAEVFVESEIGIGTKVTIKIPTRDKDAGGGRI